MGSRRKKIFELRRGRGRSDVASGDNAERSGWTGWAKRPIVVFVLVVSVWVGGGGSGRGVQVALGR
jgi:hypothetical protein